MSEKNQSWRGGHHCHHCNGRHLLADHGRVHEDVQHHSVQRQKARSASTTSCPKLIVFVRAGVVFSPSTRNTLNDRLAAGYMNGINDKYAVYYTAK